MDLYYLRKLAELEGIQTSYVDMGGRLVEAHPDTLIRLLQKFGHDLDEKADFKQTFREAEKERWKHSLPYVQTVVENKFGTLAVRRPKSVIKDNQLLATCRLESGETRQVVLRQISHGKNQNVNGADFVEAQYLIPRLPAGYHEIETSIGKLQQKCLIISAPSQLYHLGTQGRRWGVFAPLYGLHSDQSWGAGNFSDWERLFQLVVQNGGGIVSGLPILGAFLDKPVVEPSPYSPASRLFWNEFYLDLTALPEFRTSSEAQKLVKSRPFAARLEYFRSAKLVDYQGQMALQRRVVEILADEFFRGRGSRRKELDIYLQQRPEAEDYAAFRAACDKSGKSWHGWGEKQKQGKLSLGKDYDLRTFRYHLYAQWQAQSQIDRLIQTGRNSGAELYLDLPLGVHPDSYDAWRQRESFATGINAGCPPDPCFTKGQDWGFSPLDPKNMRKNRYDYLIRFFRFQMRHTGLLRVDHVMGLHRLYWIPQGVPASQGAYVSYPAEELYSILALESHRFKTTMVGENLGTVPPQVNRSMDKFGMRRMYVVQYEIQPKQPPLAAPVGQVVASLNTHDMPPFAAFETALDIDDRRKLGLLKGPEVAEEKANRSRMLSNLTTFLKKKNYLKTGVQGNGELAKAALRYLASSNAEAVLINLEDLWGEKKSQNVPGTSTERPNWQRKLKLSIEELDSDQEIAAFIREINALRNKGKS